MAVAVIVHGVKVSSLSLSLLMVSLFAVAAV